MYEVAESSKYGLEAETLRRMRDIFGGHICSACRMPAARLCGGEFFCHDHYPKAQPTGRSPRVYRCSASAGVSG
jgi:hypothetical protein